MKIVKVTNKIVKVTADEGMWLTKWTEEQDIIFFSACKNVLTSTEGAKTYHEITEAEKLSYDERRAMAEAAAIVNVVEQPMP